MKHFMARPGQPLIDHLSGVGSMMMSSVPHRWRSLAYLIGFLHDIGKFRSEWQAFLNEGGRSPGHIYQGIWVLSHHYRLKQHLPAAMAMLAHHSYINDDRLLPIHEIKKSAQIEQESKEAIANLIGSGGRLPELDEIDGFVDVWDGFFWLKILYSVLIDSDRLDAAIASGFKPASHPSINELFDKIHPQQKGGKLNQIRDKYLNDCLDDAMQPHGMRSLIGPTGIGKTLTSCAMALKMCQVHHKKKIIYIAPYCSILEQNSAVFRQLFGDRFIFEHHSRVIDRNHGEGCSDRHYQERWEHPIVCSTLVRLFEIFFGNGSSLRSLQALHDAVLIVDEVQSIPIKYLRMFLDFCDRLARDYGTMVVLLSATIPKYPTEWGFPIHETFQNGDRQYLIDAVKRVQYQYLGRVEMRAIADRVKNHHQALVVVNSTKQARELYQQCHDDGVFHLSTRMTPVHRTSVLQQVRQRLKNGDRVLLISTQLVEAGVDLDFPVGYRMMAPIPSLIQFAGRIGREAIGAIKSVFLFELEDDSVSEFIYGVELAIARAMINDDVDPDVLLHQEDATTIFFNRCAMSMDAEKYWSEYQHNCAKFDVAAIADSVALINDSPSAIVLVEGENDRIYNKAISGKTLSMTEWRSLQQYSATVGHGDRSLIKNGCWTGFYDKMIGCLTDDAPLLF